MTRVNKRHIIEIVVILCNRLKHQALLKPAVMLVNLAGQLQSSY